MTDIEESHDNESFINMAECQQLRKQIALSSGELIELTYNDQKFNRKLQQLNQLACQNIEDDKYHHAAVYLDEAEKILQYAAGCGKTIERTLITTILNNQACLLQRTSEFQQSANYLEAIIYNINEFVQACPPIQFSPESLNCQTGEYAELATYFQRKIALALYHLRFCALTSHSKNNEVALKSAKKALNILRQVSQQQYGYELYESRRRDSPSAQLNNHQKNAEFNFADKKIYKQISRIKEVEGGQTQQFNLFLSKALEYIHEYSKKIQQQRNIPHLQVLFEGYSIGNLMQASPLPLQSKPNYKQFMKNEFSQIGKLYRIIHMSMSYFTVATQLRLISSAKFALDQDQRKNSYQFKQSKTYHLISVILIARYFPCKSVFFDHAVYSFKNHYGINLLEMAQTCSDMAELDTLKSASIIKSSAEKEKFKESICSIHEPNNQEHNKTTEIHQNKPMHDIVGLVIKYDPPTIKSTNLMTEIHNKQTDAKKLRLVRSKLKSSKILLTESSRGIQTEKSIPLLTSKNKENKSKSKLQLSKAKDTIRSRRKDFKIQKNQEDQNRKNLYYGNTGKSRSKSKSKMQFQRKNSKKGLGTVKSGLVFQTKKLKNQTKIQQQYGVKSLGGFGHKAVDSKSKKVKPTGRSSQNVQEDHYTLKFNKVMGGDHARMKKMKSPRNVKGEQGQKRKTLHTCSSDQKYL